MAAVTRERRIIQRSRHITRLQDFLIIIISSCVHFFSITFWSGAFNQTPMSLRTSHLRRHLWRMKIASGNSKLGNPVATTKEREIPLPYTDTIRLYWTYRCASQFYLVRGGKGKIARLARPAIMQIPWKRHETTDLSLKQIPSKCMRI